MRYPQARKESVLKKMMAPSNRAVKVLAGEEGISEATLYNWRREAVHLKKNSGAGKKRWRNLRPSWCCKKSAGDPGGSRGGMISILTVSRPFAERRSLLLMSVSLVRTGWFRIAVAPISLPLAALGGGKERVR